MRGFLRSHILAAAALLAAMLASGAQAATGTAAGTSISNSASVAYSLSSVAQTPVSSNTATFLVDRKANVMVAEVGGTATMVSYGQTDQVTTFTVTNTTNATQDIRLNAVNSVLALPTTLGHTDTFGVTNIRVFVDSNGNGVYDAGVDTATYIDELAPDASKTVFVVADMPASGPASGVAGINLIATVAAGGTPGTLGADLTQSLVDDPAAIDTVFADTAGWVDLARDGKFSAGDEYDIAGATAQVTKTAVVISDPLNLAVSPKAIPGATVEYCIQTKNIGASAITAVTVTDNIPANTTYVAGSTYTGGTVLLGVCNFDGSAASDATVYNGSRISTTTANLAAGLTTTTRFRVTLN